MSDTKKMMDALVNAARWWGAAESDVGLSISEVRDRGEAVERAYAALTAHVSDAAKSERLRIADDLMDSAKIAEEMGAHDRAQALAWAALNLRKSGLT